MSIKRRIVNGTLANSAGIAMSAIAQLISVPVLTNAWGAERYGVWLMLTTIPAYFVLSDLGFGSAATSDMTMQIARGESKRARATFQSVWVLVNLVSAVFIVLTVAAVETLSKINSSSEWMNEYGPVLILLAVYSAAALNARVISAGLRATQNYAIGTLLFEGTILIEILSVLAVAVAGYGFALCAAAMLAARSCNVLLLLLSLRRRVPWLRPGLVDASSAELRRLWTPALGAMAIPGVLAVSLQGMVLVAGIIISASAAATVASVRTVSRVAIQMVGVINRATVPELSTATARDQKDALTKIVAVNLASIGLILIPGAILFMLFGAQAVAIWTHGKILPEPSFVHLIAIAMLAHGLWYYTSNLLLASNKHTLVAVPLVVISVGSVFAAIPLAYSHGLVGVGGMIAAAEIVCLVRVLRTAFQLKIIDLAELERALKPRFWQS